jgi:hypothetical protein
MQYQITVNWILMIYKLWRSPYSLFGGLASVKPDDKATETIQAINYYDDNMLMQISQNGFNAIWVHGEFANLVHVSDCFKELGKNYREHINAMQELIRRAAIYGIKVFIYMQPIRAVAVENRLFWDNHADVAGQEEFAIEQVIKERLDEEILMRSLCSSTRKVKDYIRYGAQHLARSLPGLGGLILITASEYPGHCYSHRGKRKISEYRKEIECPRCKEREPYEVVSELINLIHEGIRKESESIEIVAWNWGWTSFVDSPCREIVDNLASDIIIMADFERGGFKNMSGRGEVLFDEYSLIYGGPSPRCEAILDYAASRKMRIMTKLQLGATHELATVVSLPLIGNIYDKALYQRQHPECGYMGCWNFGNMTSANTYGFNYFQRTDCPENKKHAMTSFAKDYFGNCAADQVLAGWELFVEAMDYFPFSIPFLYNGVHSHALAYSEIYKFEPLNGEPVGCSYLNLRNKRGDDLRESLSGGNSGYSLDETIERLGKMTVLWAKGVKLFENGMKGCDDRHEVGNAIIVGGIWRSTENAYKAYRLRKGWNRSKSRELFFIIKDEIINLKAVLPWLEKDPRQGYHGEAHQHFFNSAKLLKKIAILEELVTGS